MTKFEVIVNGEEKVFTEEQIVAEIERIIKEHMYLRKTEEGCYEGSIYVDYQDELGRSHLEYISQSDNPREAFYETLDEVALDSTMHEEDQFMQTIRENWNEEEFGDVWDYESFIRDWMFEKVYYNFPYDHFLKQDVLVNILVNTGDGDYDFTLNNFYSYNGRGVIEGDHEESSILWLVKQQGYTPQELQKAYEEGTDNPFLHSVIQELENVTSHMNALTFFVRMTVEEFIELKEAKEHVKIDKDVNVGLLDIWMGAGSIHEITLEKDVTIPVEFVEPHIDGCRGYGAERIYGMSWSHWKDSVIEVK